MHDKYKRIGMCGDVDLVEAFRKRRGQFALPCNSSNDVQEKPKKKKTSSPQYDSFLKKYNNLEENIDSLNNRDLVYYFRKIAEDSGYRYTISNIQKDMHIFKVLRQSYDSREICGMIEFLYLSDQDYLDRERLSPNILASRWINTIYADFKLWVEDEYIPKSKKAKKLSNSSKGEWSSDDSTTTVGVKF